MSIGEQSRFSGMLRVVQFNAPLYLAAAVTVAILFFLIMQPHFGLNLKVILLVIALAIVLQTLASLVASHWIYDLSPLKTWEFLRKIGDDNKRQIVNVHSGYDETSGALRKQFSVSNIATIDLFPALGRREPSIVKARELYPPLTPSVCTSIDNWPIADSSVDLILIAFAAHELRDAAKRELLFAQASKVLNEHGRIVLVEHVRDLANFIAFGPGFMHFLPLSEWIRCAKVSNLKIDKQYRITPLIAVLELCR